VVFLTDCLARPAWSHGHMVTFLWHHWWTSFIMCSKPCVFLIVYLIVYGKVYPLNQYPCYSSSFWSVGDGWLGFSTPVLHHQPTLFLCNIDELGGRPKSPLLDHRRAEWGGWLRWSPGVTAGCSGQWEPSGEGMRESRIIFNTPRRSFCYGNQRWRVVLHSFYYIVLWMFIHLIYQKQDLLYGFIHEQLLNWCHMFIDKMCSQAYDIILSFHLNKCHCYSDELPLFF